ncbi:carboxypeptidase-like regulatory domain-containing protein [Solirubrobacter soli]|uniref:carboxypeptidase-like regulatory domain-containing protein n=1 Tax=Solirubrobacter soli TaxID=363832 RepID=UPI00040F150E|nr:carboxypeptidase-like regulatory domain-containing protein [Solirubrobacter soli]
MSRRLTLAFLALLLAAPATAQAGTYHVYTCAAGGKVYPNGAWKAVAASGVLLDSSCAGNFIALTVPAGARMANNTSAALTFTTPPGTTIADFALTRQIGFTNPVADGTHKYFLFYSLGPTIFAGAGNYADPTRNALNAQKQWYGYPDGNVAVAKSGVSRASFPALAAYKGDANTLSLRVGCFNRGTPCSVAAGGAISHILHGSDVTISDPTAPTVTVEASGLLAGGARNGSDPVTVTASDNSGIRTIELIDVSNPAAPVLVGVEDYGEGVTDAKKACDYSQPAPCPNLTRETIRATSLTTGTRSVLVRVTDAGGNIVDRGPYQVWSVTPSDRGALNGSGATDTGTLSVIWTKGLRANRRTLDYGERAGVRGRLTNSSGAPITGAKVTLLSRDLRQGASLIPRATFTTDGDGRFSTTVTASASRLLQFAWLSHANDIRFGANGYLTLQARAASTLSVSTRRPRVGRALTISGRLKGVSRGGVPIVVQGRPKGSRHYETFADTTTSAGGRFKVRYRFRSSASRGHSFVFRARIRPAAKFPYETGYSSTATVRVR